MSLQRKLIPGDGRSVRKNFNRLSFWILFVSKDFLLFIFFSRNNSKFSIYPNNNGNYSSFSNDSNNCSNFNNRSSCINNNESDDDNCSYCSNSNSCSNFNNRSSCIDNNESDEWSVNNCSNCSNNNSCSTFNYRSSCINNNESNDNNCSNFNSNSNHSNNESLRLQWGKPRSYDSFFPFKYILTLLLRYCSLFFHESGVVLIAPNGKGVVAWMRGKYNSAARRDFLFAKLALSTRDR